MSDRLLRVCGLLLMVGSLVAVLVEGWEWAIWAALAAIFFNLESKGG